MTNTLFISYDGMTDPLGQSQVIPYLAGLSEKGYAISLISCEKEENYSAHQSTIESVLKQHKIDWYPLPYHKKPPILSTLKDVNQIQQKAIELHQKKTFKLVHCRSYIAALIGLKLKRKLGIKFIFDMRGFWADERVDGGLWNLKNPIYRLIYTFFKHKEKDFLTNADFTISLTTNAQKEIHSWKGFENTPIQVIPCCVDLHHFQPQNIENNNLKTALGIQKIDFILSYIGSIGTWYMLTEMLEFYKVVASHYPNAKFLFVTKDNPKQIINEAKRLDINIANVLITSSERKDVPAYISISNLSVFFIKPLYSKKASSPTKQGEIMAMNIPIVCNTNVGDTDFVVQKYHSGIVINDFSEKEYERVMQNYKNTTFTNLRDGAYDFFSLEKGIDLYTNVYNEVLN